MGRLRLLWEGAPWFPAIGEGCWHRSIAAASVALSTAIGIPVAEERLKDGGTAVGAFVTARRCGGTVVSRFVDCGKVYRLKVLLKVSQVPGWRGKGWRLAGPPGPWLAWAPPVGRPDFGQFFLGRGGLRHHHSRLLCAFSPLVVFCLSGFIVSSGMFHRESIVNQIDQVALGNVGTPLGGLLVCWCGWIWFWVGVAVWGSPGSANGQTVPNQ